MIEIIYSPKLNELIPKTRLEECLKMINGDKESLLELSGNNRAFRAISYDSTAISLEDMTYADVWVPSFKIAIHYVPYQDKEHTSALNLILKRILEWNQKLHGQVHHHVLIKIPSELLYSPSGRSAFLIMNQIMIKKLLVEHSYQNARGYSNMRIHGVNSNEDIADCMVSLIPSANFKINQLSNEIIQEATVIKFQSIREAAIQSLGEGDLSLHDSYVILDSMRSMSALCLSSVQDLHLNCNLKKDVAQRLSARINHSRSG